MKILYRIRFLCIVTVSLITGGSSTCKPMEVSGRNDNVFQEVTNTSSSDSVINESEHCKDGKDSLNKTTPPQSSRGGYLLRKVRSENGQEEKYPTEDDRAAVRLALDKENLTVRVYNILQEDLLYCPASSSCRISPRLHYSNLMPHLSCCIQCSCKKDCHASNTCCADVDTIASDQSTTECITLQYLPYGKSKLNNKYQVKAVIKCHASSTARETRDLCESQEPRLRSINTTLPVFVNGTVYRNRYCALCNFVPESVIVPFRGQVKCPGTTGVYASSITNLLQTLEDEKRCNILYYNPLNTHAIMNNECNAGLVRECNVTGKWDHYDPDVEQACLSYTHVYQFFYRNVFCYMCNNEANPVMKCSREDLGGGHGNLVLGSFTAMLSFSEEVQEETVDSRNNQSCRKDEIFDIIQNACVTVRCSIPFSYNIGKKICLKVFQDKIIAYELFLHITSDLQIKTYLVLPFITDYLRSGNSFNLLYQRMFQMPHQNSTIPSHKIYHIIFQNTDSSHQIFHILGVAKYIKTIFKGVNEVEILTGQVYTDFYNLSTYTFPNDGQQLQQIDNPYNMGTSAIFFRTKLVTVSRLLVCPFIILQNYTITLERIKYKLCIEELDHCFQQTEFREINDTFSVCVDDFKTKMEELRRTRKTSVSPEDSHVEGVLSLFCTCISVASLLYVVVTFLLFKSLRTLPGKLILILSLSLLLAHLLYQFGLFQTDHSTLCRFLGVLIHFSWLWVIFWMNVSCFHMVSVFTRVFPHELNNGSRLICYVIYDLFISLVFVSINIAVSYIRGTGIGYGGKICWISTPQMVGYVFALPLGLVILSNLLMFVGVVVSLHRRPNLQRRKHRDRQDFIIFIKLTSITGISWVFGFLFEWFGIRVFSYIFIILTGCQGLYLMLSFSCNSRVRKLYTSAVKGSTNSSNTSVSSSVYHVTRSSKEFHS